MALEREMSWEETVHNIQSSSTSFQWTDEQLKSLDENQEYHAKMLETIAIVRKQGPIKKVPKQPKRKLSDLFKEIEGTKKPKTQMTSSELNEYLKKHLVDIQLVSKRSFFINMEQTTNKTNMIKHLRKGYQYIGRQNAETLMFFLQFGKLLITVFSFFQEEKKEGKLQGSWDDWLRDNVGISASFSRELRDLAFIINPSIYPKFLTLGLSFTEIYSLKKQIQEMLSETYIAEQWKQIIPVPETQHSSQATN